MPDEQSAAQRAPTSDDLTSSKLALEVAKLQAETTRANLEIKLLTRPWFLQPAIMQPLAAIIITVGAGIIGSYSGWFQVRTDSLRNAADKAAIDLAKLNDRRSEVETEIKALTADRDNVTNERNDLSQRLEKAQSDVSRLSGKVAQGEAYRLELQRIQTQLDQIPPEKSVFMITSNRCGDPPDGLSETGFRLKGTKGLVTNLHRLVDCQGHSARQRGTSYANLRIDKVNILADLAVMTSPELDEQPDNGLVIGGLPTAGEELRVLGSYIAAMAIPQNVKAISMGNLRNFLPQPFLLRLESRGSPDVSRSVILLDGAVAPGTIGGPILTRDNKVVGVFGGTREANAGASASAWAIPLSGNHIGNQEWQSWETLDDNVKQKLKKWPFDFSN